MTTCPHCFKGKQGYMECYACGGTGQVPYADPEPSKADVLQMLLDESQEYHRSCIADAYRLLGIDGSDGEFRYKWVALEIARLKEWTYCPECGSTKLHHQEGKHRQCGDCGQEYFTDIDYTKVVQEHLWQLSELRK